VRLTRAVRPLFAARLVLWRVRAVSTRRYARRACARSAVAPDAWKRLKVVSIAAAIVPGRGGRHMRCACRGGARRRMREGEDARESLRRIVLRRARTQRVATRRPALQKAVAAG